LNSKTKILIGVGLTLVVAGAVWLSLPPSSQPPPREYLVEKGILVNLRTLSTFAYEYVLGEGIEQTDYRVTYQDLVTKFPEIESIQPLEGEDYSALVFTPETEAIAVTTSRGKTVAYTLP
jgi:hypothetical protein